MKIVPFISSTIAKKPISKPLIIELILLMIVFSEEWKKTNPLPRKKKKQQRKKLIAAANKAGISIKKLKPQIEKLKKDPKMRLGYTILLLAVKINGRNLLNKLSIWKKSQN